MTAQCRFTLRLMVSILSLFSRGQTNSGSTAKDIRTAAATAIEHDDDDDDDDRDDDDDDNVDDDGNDNDNDDDDDDDGDDNDDGDVSTTTATTVTTTTAQYNFRDERLFRCDQFCPNIVKSELSSWGKRPFKVLLMHCRAALSQELKFQP